MTELNRDTMNGPVDNFLYESTLAEIHDLLRDEVNVTKRDLVQMRDVWIPMLKQKVDYVLPGKETFAAHLRKQLEIVEKDNNHKMFFYEEDTASYKIYQKFYDWWRPAGEPNRWKDVMKELEKWSATIMTLKNVINRPRPFQTSYYLNIPITIQNTWAGQHPSIPSGHCFQSLLFGALIVSYHTPDKERIQVLAQYVKDIGNRRVMGGQHYPSDNIISKNMYKKVVAKIGIAPLLIGYNNIAL